MNELQTCQFEMLKEFIKTCEENNLTYFLCAGTCLGAVRHKGFIPWDDDIDVMMPREDFDKLRAIKKPFKKDNYFLQSYKSDPCFIFNYMRMRDSNTTFLRQGYGWHRINHGVWIDIFPLDGLGRTEEVKNRWFKFRGKNNLLNLGLVYPYSLRRKPHWRTFFVDFWLNLFALVGAIMNIGHYRNKMLDRRARRIPYSEAKIVGSLFGFNPGKEFMSKSYFGKGTDGEFEGLKVRLPENYDLYLKRMYGDYMQLPPEEDRIGHHYLVGLDLHTPYKEYLKKHHRI